MSDFIIAEGIVKRFAEHTALDHVGIRVPEGKVFGLLGPNGAGKTTLIRIINHITVADEGSVTFDGHLLCEADMMRIGYLLAERGLYKKMKVGEQAVYLARRKGLSERDAKQRLKYWFEKFDIMPWWHRKLEELAKGMQQKVQFITTVLHEPPLLIFDEPFSGFDPVNAELLKREILELRDKGHTILFSTHNMASVEELCDSIALINHSKVVLQGTVETTRAQYKDDRLKRVTIPDSSPIPPDLKVVNSEISHGRRRNQFGVPDSHRTADRDLSLRRTAAIDERYLPTRGRKRTRPTT